MFKNDQYNIDRFLILITLGKSDEEFVMISPPINLEFVNKLLYFVLIIMWMNSLISPSFVVVAFLKQAMKWEIKKDQYTELDNMHFFQSL
jgi:hypothetical protein